MKLTRIAIRIFGLGLATATMCALATPPPTASPAPASRATLSTIIPCESSPFGKGAPVTQDLEPMLLLWRDKNYNSITEFRPSEGSEPLPLQPVYSNAMYQPPLTDAKFRKAINADLNGDGRDEIVAVFQGGDALQIAVYSRTTTPGMSLIDTWTYAAIADFDSIDIAAGDLDGSTDQQQEIALSWNGPTTHLIVLKGDSSGRIASADGSYSGRYDLPESLFRPRIAVGDFLLAGRQQMVLAGYIQTPSVLAFKLYLTELDDGSNPDSVTAALPAVGTSMRAADPFLNNFHGPGSGRYIVIDGGSPVIQVDGIQGLDADAGDLVDTAAAELVLHLLFQGHVEDENRTYLVARLLHFATARDPQTDEIVGVALVGGQTSYDSTILIQREPPEGILPGSFDAMVAEVDGLPGAEIVTAWVSNLPPSLPLAWSVHRARLQLVPSFQYKNQGMQNGRPVVQFINNSHGSIAKYTWDFGASNDQAQTRDPAYTYNNTGTYPVTLTIDGYDGTSKHASYNVHVTGGTDESPQGPLPAPRTYFIDPAEEFGGVSDKRYTGLQNDPYDVHLAAGDMGQDSTREIVIAKKYDAMVDMHVLERNPNNPSEFWHTVHEYSTSLPAGVTYMDMLLADPDGDSINGVLNDAEGDCRIVRDDLIQSLTWVPPYFSYLQGNSGRSARYGTTSDTGQTAGTSSSSSISSDTTITLGFGGEITVPVVGVVAEATLKYKAGYVHQSNTGEQHSDAENYKVDEGVSIADSNMDANQEGLLRLVHTKSSCYTYSLETASGTVPNSNMRMCQHGRDPADEIEDSSGVVNWNLLAGETPPIQVPSVWVPLQRDWASVALFRTPASGSRDNNLQWVSGTGPGQATDGKFTTAAESRDTEEPYLEIDLGSVQQITSVRVFPKVDSDYLKGVYKPISFREFSRDLAGFRLYVSATPFANSGLPTNASDTTVDENGISTFVQDMKGDQSTQAWNVWTGSPSSGMPLFGRYVRLQKPDSGRLAISEIQVFGASHVEPPAFPEAVCDPFVGDGLFDAWVYNDAGQFMTTIELRGDMVWSGATDAGRTGIPTNPTGTTFCENDTLDELANEIPFPTPLLPAPAKHAAVRQAEIWSGKLIGSNGVGYTWNLAEHTSITDGTGYTASNGFHLGAEFEAKGGAYVKLIGGVAQKVSFSWSSGSQSSVTYGEGFSVGGTVTGFNDDAARDLCGYYPRPYSYQVTNVSNLGAKHSIYVTDYVVKQATYATAGYWQRGTVPAACFGVTSPDDIIFTDGFEEQVD